MIRNDGWNAQKPPSSRAIADVAPIGIFRADPAGNITYINPALERISGVRATRAVGRSWLRATPEEGREDAEREWNAAIAAGKDWATDFRFLHPDGSTRFASILMTAEPAEEGKATGFVGFVTDITEQRTAQSELRRSERLYRLLAENATDIIVRLDLDDHVTYASPAMGEVTGFSAEETLGINPISFMHPEDAPAAREQSRKLKAGEIEQAVIEYRTPHKNGHFIWVEARSRLVRDERGNPQEVISVVRDISAHKRLEAALIGAREAEHQASAAQGRFLATMSHEIRTPISGVIGMIDLLINAKSEDDLPRYREALAASAQTLLRVVDDVLDYSKMSTVGIVLQAEPFDILKAAHNVVDLYHPAAKEKGLTLGLNFQTSSRTVVGDATRLRQVLGNLVSNAIKFTERGRIDIEVSNIGQRWTFAVIDTGIGLREEDRSRLFDAFAQADRAVAGKVGGTGLGLTISRIIVEAMGGTLSVSSVPGEGSRFMFELDLEPARTGDVIPREVEAPTMSECLKILVAEDNDINRLYLQTLLQRMGHDVTVVADGAAAVEAATSCEFDAILLDLHMPTMKGDDAADLIRQARPDAVTKLILVSAAGSGGRPSRAQERRSSPFDATLPKPVRPEQLTSLLATCGRQPRSSRSERKSTKSTQAGLSPAEIGKLERLFRDDLERRLPMLDEALNANDQPALQKQAHAIAGSAYLLGNEVLGDLARDVEHATYLSCIAAVVSLRQACVEHLSVTLKP